MMLVAQENIDAEQDAVKGGSAYSCEDQDIDGELLDPEYTPNPVLRRFYTCVERFVDLFAFVEFMWWRTF